MSDGPKVTQFVIATGPLSNGRADRNKLVRAYVMKEHHRRREASKKNVQLSNNNPPDYSGTNGVQWVGKTVERSARAVNASTTKSKRQASTKNPPRPKPSANTVSSSPPVSVKAESSVSPPESAAQDLVEYRVDTHTDTPPATDTTESPIGLRQMMLGDADSKLSVFPLDPSFGSPNLIYNNISNYLEIYMNTEPFGRPKSSDSIMAGLSSPSVMHAFHLKFYTWLSLCRGAGITQSSYAQKYKTICTINRSLSQPKEACSDQVITAVLELMSFEYIIGSVHDYEIHQRGMEHMIRLRGGVHNVPQDLRASIMKHRRLMRIMLALEMQPSSRHDANDSSQPRPHRPANSDMFTFGLALDMAHISQYAPQLVRTMSAMQELACLATEYCRADTPTFFRRKIGFRWAKVHGEIEKLFQSTERCTMDANLADIYESCYLAFKFLSYSGPEPQLLQGYAEFDMAERASRLQGCMYRSDLRSFWLPVPGALLWCTAIAATLVPARRESPFFRMNMYRAATIGELVSPEESAHSMDMIAKALESVREIQTSRRTGSVSSTDDDYTSFSSPSGFDGWS